MRQRTDATGGTCLRCGAPVLRFSTDVGLDIELEAEQLPITTDLEEFRRVHGFVWVLNPPPSGRWVTKFGFRRDWRDHRAEHRCQARTPREREST